MKKRVLSVFAAGITGAMFGVLYPEYILLPDTYQYIEEINCQSREVTGKECDMETDIEKMLYSDPENIVISSRFFEFLAEEGIVLCKNLYWDIMNMP